MDGMVSDRRAYLCQTYLVFSHSYPLFFHMLLFPLHCFLLWRGVGEWFRGCILVSKCKSHVRVVCFGWIWEEVESGECFYSCVVFDV